MSTLSSPPHFVNGENARLREKRGDEAAVFGRHLRELRLVRGLTQAQVAERCGTMVPVISNLERGMTVPTLSTMLHLARALECRPSELVKIFDGNQDASRTSRKH
jgi:transcriptional regulator with XRE-family HTH domain